MATNYYNSNDYTPTPVTSSTELAKKLKEAIAKKANGNLFHKDYQLYYNNILKRIPGTENTKHRGKYTVEFTQAVKQYALTVTKDGYTPVQAIATHFNEPVGSISSLLEREGVTVRTSKAKRKLKTAAKKVKPTDRTQFNDSVYNQSIANVIIKDSYTTALRQAIAEMDKQINQLIDAKTVLSNLIENYNKK